MKKLLLALFTLVTAVNIFAADEEKPIITFKTNIYDTYGASNSFSIRLGATRQEYFDVDCGAGKNEVLVDVAQFDSEAAGIKATRISCNVGPEGIVKIYGDASLIDYFDGEGAYIDWIDFGECTNLDIIDLQHNELKHLDLSPYTKLSAIYLTDNPFTPETPLVIGENHPDLIILEVDIIDYISPDFDITTYPELQSFDAYANKSLYHLDPSKCTKLRRLSVDSCPIRSLDVSKNTALEVLNVEDSGIIELDLSNNPKLRQLFLRKESGVLNTDRKFTSIDISKNPELTFFTANGNHLTSIDVSNNPKLDNLNVANNFLTHIDVSNQKNLVNFDISSNYFTFATLPDPDPAWYDFVYDQRPMIVEKSYPEGATIDLADKVLRPNTATAAELYAYNFAENTSRKLDQSYYSYENGVVTLKKACSDSLYLSFANSAFSGMALESTRFMVKTADQHGKPSQIVEFATISSEGAQIKMSVGIAGATEQSPKTFFVDPGDGKLVELRTAVADMPALPNVDFVKRQSSPVKIYIPEGETLTAFGLDGLYLTKIDLTKAVELRHLSLRNSELYEIDLRYNRDLRSLALTGNHFGANFSLQGINGISAKSMLSDIDLSNNEMTAVTLNDTRSIRHLNLSHNKFDSFGYKEFEYIKSFDISYNRLSTINAVYMSSADLVDVSHNLLTEISLPTEGSVKELNLNDNLFTLADIPEKPALTAIYRYAPQAELQMPVKAPGADLSAQNRVIDGKGTVFVWKTVDGFVLTEGTDYRVVNGGTTFLASMVGKKVYCEMTNPAFPDFNGDNVFRTTTIEASEAPSNMIASFVTANDGQAELSLAAAKEGTAVYIDWGGEGYNMDQYVLGTTYRRFSGKTVAGATAKVYTYSTDDRITVFSVDGAAMSGFDGTNLTDAILVGIYNAGLSEIKLPDSDRLEELCLSGNAFTELPDLSAYTHIHTLDMAGNRLTSADLGKITSLQTAYLGSNKLTEIKFKDNNLLWLLFAAGNKISSIEFNGAPEIEQLDLAENELSTIDISPLKKLSALQISRNRFDFTTLPMPTAQLTFYSYLNQTPLEVQCVNGKVDLSSQAMVADKPTTYRWFVGAPEVDEDGNLIGEELVVDEEYTVENGVTTFHTTLDGVMCVMTNPVFPKLYLYTTLMGVTASIDDVEMTDDSEPVYYNLQGLRVDRPVPGKVYIMRRGTSTSKILFR